MGAIVSKVPLYVCVRATHNAKKYAGVLFLMLMNNFPILKVNTAAGKKKVFKRNFVIVG